ncbi:MAG: hypothetical protein F4087_12250 [Gemmatimonadetes bacterium]|nr:hypothetical protein [Gemmatimonadota bacterium]MYJ69264.1 hypothetical protein [Gemmatimonadota bacterium]
MNKRFVKVIAVGKAHSGAVRSYYANPIKMVVNADMVGECVPHEYPTEKDEHGNVLKDGKTAHGSMICVQVGQDRVITMTPSEFLAAADPPEPEPEPEKPSNDPPPKEK